jgi:predicted nuclease of predicted toxin-antitoxin system
VRFPGDAQLPPALARFLESRGHEANHVVDLGLGDASDGEIWDHALLTGAVIVTKDEDFAVRITLDPSGPPIVWIRVGNTTKHALLRWIEPLLPMIEDALAIREKLIEVR